MSSDTIYAVCHTCAHFEPRPAHAADDWQPCESCGARVPDLHDDLQSAEEASAELLECHGHPAEDCGPMGLHASIGDVIYCNGDCRPAAHVRTRA